MNVVDISAMAYFMCVCVCVYGLVSASAMILYNLNSLLIVTRQLHGRRANDVVIVETSGAPLLFCLSLKMS